METISTPQLISYLTIRKAIGWLGILLPFGLWLGNWAINELNLLNSSFWVNLNCSGLYSAEAPLKSSISHYYYSTVGELFTGTLCAVALFLLSYKGYPLRQGEFGLSDDLMCDLAGVFALGVVIFPTSSDGCVNDSIRSFLSSKNTGYIHFIFAGLFFVTLALLCIINFRRTNQVNVYGKSSEHNFYLVCGIIMMACLLLLLLYSFFLESQFPALKDFKITFVLETIALFFFGLSWLTKGDVDYYFLLKKIKLNT